MPAGDPSVRRSLYCVRSLTSGQEICKADVAGWGELILWRFGPDFRDKVFSVFWTEKFAVGTLTAIRKEVY